MLKFDLPALVDKPTGHAIVVVGMERSDAEEPSFVREVLDEVGGADNRASVSGCTT
jgi:hypothetical protein